MKPVSGLLAGWEAGEREALHAPVPLIYRDLRRQAHQYLRGERPGHTLQTTALVHEAFLRLHHQGPAHYESRAHFFAIAAQLMCQILVDHADTKKAAKRDWGVRLTLQDISGLTKSRDVDLIELDQALNSLAILDSQQSLVVELRFFAALSIEETSRCRPRTALSSHAVTIRALRPHTQMVFEKPGELPLCGGQGVRNCDTAS